MTSALSELLFVFLPFIVIAITLAHQGELGSILSIPEWSIVTAVITGQAIVKFASFGIGRTAVHKQNIVLILSILLVCLLVPILVILAIVLTSSKISITLKATQAVFFGLGIIAFFVACRLDYYAREA